MNISFILLLFSICNPSTILWTIITVAPLFWMAYSSFKTNEELTKDIYSMPYELFHVRDGYLDVVEPQTNIVYPKGMLEKLGIVYTPVPVVDFILHSTEYVLNKEFGRSISDEKVNVIDPFTGTGTFITRLMQSGIIKPEDVFELVKFLISENNKITGQTILMDSGVVLNVINKK